MRRRGHLRSNPNPNPIFTALTLTLTLSLTLSLTLTLTLSLTLALSQPLLSYLPRRGAAVTVREWRAAAKRLATPSRRSPTRAALVATVVSYQLAEIDAEIAMADDEIGAEITADGVDRVVEVDADTKI